MSGVGTVDTPSAELQMISPPVHRRLSFPICSRAAAHRLARLGCQGWGRLTLPVQLSPPVHRALSFQWEPMWEPQENLSVFPTDFCISSSHDALAMGDAADPRRASSALSRSWQLILAPWSEAQRAALRRFGNDESSVLLFALRTDGGKLEVFVTCKAPRYRQGRGRQQTARRQRGQQRYAVQCAINRCSKNTSVHWTLSAFVAQPRGGASVTHQMMRA